MAQLAIIPDMLPSQPLGSVPVQTPGYHPAWLGLHMQLYLYDFLLAILCLAVFTAQRPPGYVLVGVVLQVQQ